MPVFIAVNDVGLHVISVDTKVTLYITELLYGNIITLRKVFLQCFDMVDVVPAAVRQAGL